MKSLKNMATGFLAIATAVVTFSTSSAMAQDFDRYERGDRRDRPGMGRDRDDRAQRNVYLGSTGLVSKNRYETREIYVGSDERFSGLVFVARDDDFDMRQVTVYFGNGGSRNLGGARIGEGGRVRADFQNSRRIESIVIQGKSLNPFGSKAQLEVYGRR